MIDRTPLVKKIELGIVCSIIACVFCVVTAAFVYSELETTRAALEKAASIQSAPTREQIQVAVIRLLQAGRASELYAFYAQEVGDPVRAELYIAMAVVKHEPVDLVISLGWWEGGHMVGKTDGPNTDGSVDYRPMGVNSFTYRNYTPEELQQVETNINLATNHLYDDRIQTPSWEAALARYNSGRADVFSPLSIEYVYEITKHEWDLDRRFAARFADAL